MILAGAKPVAWYADGPAAGGPAITRHDLGDGQAWYLSARADAADHRRPARRRRARSAQASSAPRPPESTRPAGRPVAT